MTDLVTRPERDRLDGQRLFDAFTIARIGLLSEEMNVEAEEVEEALGCLSYAAAASLWRTIKGMQQ